MRIAISGAGVAGPTLAYWLERTGHEPTLIETAPALRAGGYIIDFWGVGYTVAERMGIIDDVRAAGYRVQEVRFVDQRGRKVGGFSADVFGRMTNDRYTSLPRGELAKRIFQAVEGRVETIFGDEIAAIEAHDAGARVTFERGTARDFDLVIGADGLHSKVRTLAFGPQERFEHHRGYRVVAFDVAGYRPREELVYVISSAPGGMAARFSERDDCTMFLFVFTADRMADPEPHDAASGKATLRRVFDGFGWEVPQILEAMGQAEDVYFDRVSQIRMDAWSKGRVMLIGDAASCVSLLAGEGTGLAMTQAYVLAGELARAQGDWRTAFARSEARLRPFIEGKQKSAAAFASSFAPKTRLGVFLRNQATKLLAFPPAADFFIGRDLRDDFELPDYGI